MSKNNPKASHSKPATAWKPCHSNGTLIFSTPFKLYAGNYKGAYDRRYDLLINLAGTHSARPMISGERLSPTLAAFAEKYQSAILHIDWPDMSIPKLTKPEWYDLFEAISGDPEVESVYVFCQGGHGRTGTFITIMSGLAGVLPPPGQEDPGAYIRRIYCEDAMETNGQMDYAEEMADIKITVAPSKHYGGTWQSDVYGGASSTGSSVGKVHTPGKASLPPAKKSYAEDELDPSGRPLDWPADWYKH